MKKTIWNAKPLKYSEDLTSEDFATTAPIKEVVVTRFKEPVNEGIEAGWKYKNLLTKDVSEKYYVAWIYFEPGTGHDYHAHSGDEIIYVLKNQVQVAYRSKEDKDIKLILKEGDVIYSPAGTPHSCWNIGDRECVFLVIKSPPYFLEEIPLPSALKQVKLKE